MSLTDIRINKIANSDHPYWPNWFKLDNYKCLETISASQFINELQERLRLLHTPCDSKGRRLTDDRTWRAITQGHVLLDYSSPPPVPDVPSSSYNPQISLDYLNSEIGKQPSAKDNEASYQNLLPDSLAPIQYESINCEAVKELKAADIEALYQDFLESNGTPIQPDYLFPSKGNGTVLLALDLASADNALLLSNLAYIIDQLRIRNNVKEPKLPRLSKTHIKSFKKLLFYKAIPYLDLMLHCHNAVPNDEHWQPLKFSYPMLAKLLLGDSSEAELFKLKYQRFFKLFNGKPENDERLALLFSTIRQHSKTLNTAVKAL